MKPIIFVIYLALLIAALVTTIPVHGDEAPVFLAVEDADGQLQLLPLSDVLLTDQLASASGENDDAVIAEKRGVGQVVLRLIQQAIQKGPAAIKELVKQIGLQLVIDGAKELGINTWNTVKGWLSG